MQISACPNWYLNLGNSGRLSEVRLSQKNIWRSRIEIFQFQSWRSRLPLAMAMTFDLMYGWIRRPSGTCLMGRRRTQWRWGQKTQLSCRKTCLTSKGTLKHVASADIRSIHTCFLIFISQPPKHISLSWTFRARSCPYFAGGFTWFLVKLPTFTLLFIWYFSFECIKGPSLSKWRVDRLSCCSNMKFLPYINNLQLIMRNLKEQSQIIKRFMLNILPLDLQDLRIANQKHNFEIPWSWLSDIRQLFDIWHCIFGKLAY